MYARCLQWVRMRREQRMMRRRGTRWHRNMLFLHLTFFLSLSVCGFLPQPQGPLETPLLSDPITISASSTVNRLMNTNVNQPAGPVSKWNLAYGDFSIPKWRPFIFKGPDSWRNQWRHLSGTLSLSSSLPPFLSLSYCALCKGQRTRARESCIFGNKN